MKSYGTDKISRLLRILTLLGSGRSYSVDELAEDLQVSRRTVFRDLNALEAAHVPYYYDEEVGGYKLTDNFFLPAINFDLQEALAVMLLTAGGRQDALVPGLEFSQMAAIKIEGVLPPSVRDHVGGFLDAFQINRGAVAMHKGCERMLLQLAGAIAERQVCQVLYNSVYDSSCLEMELHPLRLVFIGRAWYLLAWSPRHDQVRNFKLVRFQRLDVLSDRNFEPPEGVDVSNHFGQAWSMIPEGRCYNIHLRFHPRVASSVAEVCWHPSQEIYWSSGGELDFHVRVDGLGEITPWILGYGDLVEVIKPAALIDRVVRSAARVARMYEAGSPGQPGPTGPTDKSEAAAELPERESAE